MFKLPSAFVPVLRITFAGPFCGERGAVGRRLAGQRRPSRPHVAPPFVLTIVFS